MIHVPNSVIPKSLQRFIHLRSLGRFEARMWTLYAFRFVSILRCIHSLQCAAFSKKSHKATFAFSAHHEVYEISPWGCSMQQAPQICANELFVGGVT